MNREHRYNTLTPNFLKQVSRGVETMNIDHSVEVIYLGATEGKHFTNGTDFRTLMHYQKQNELEKSANYIGDLYKL